MSGRRTGPPAAGERVRIPAGGAILLDKLGAVAIRTEPDDEHALLIELGGRLNKSDVRRTEAYLLAPGQAAELVAAVVVAVQTLNETGDPDAVVFGVVVAAAIAAERDRLAAIAAEHG